MRKSVIIISAIILLLLPSGFSAAGQNAEVTFCADSLSKRFSTFSSWCSPEKVYLHLDRAYYASGENIWFSGYVSNASSLSVLPTSNYIYAELLDGYFGVVDRVKIKKGRDGEFAGCIELSDNIESGYYTLRAYTLWQINSDPEYMFHQKPSIIAYKVSDFTGRVIPCGGHPEQVADGERRDLMAAYVKYAFDGVGIAKAKELIFSGKMIKADEAKEIGLVNAVYAPEELMNGAVAMAKSFTVNAPIAVKYAKACIDRGMQMDIDDGIALENELFAMCFATEDQKEGMGAFLEKRKHEPYQNK